MITSIQLEGIGDPHDYRKVTKRYKGRYLGGLRRLSLACRGRPTGAGACAYGGVAERPLRLLETESLLNSRAFTTNLIEEAVELARREVSPLSDVRASARYRRHLVGVLLKDSLEAQLASMSDGEISP